MKSRKKNQRKWESNYHQVPEEYSNSKKEKEFLSKYRHIAGEYLEDWEFIELFKKNNFDEELISKELNKIILGDEFKWKEIKNGKPVTTRSTDQVRKKQRYYKNEKSYNVYDKEEDRNESYNKRKMKGSYHKNLNEYYHYANKKPKRPFQKCIEVPSDYLPMKNNNNINYNINNTQDNKNENITDNTSDDNNNNINNKILPSKSANNLMKLEKNNKNIKEIQTNSANNENKKAIKKTLPINMNLNMNKIEETKNDENEKITSEEEQRRIILIKGEVFKSLKRLKTNTETKLKENKNRQKELYKEKDSSEKRIKTSAGIDSDYSLSNQDIKNDKALQKKYLKIFFGNMNHYSKKQENNIKRATSKDSETSDDRTETVKRSKKNNIPTSSNIIQKKSRAVNINNINNNINKNLRRAYELDQRNREIESKVVNITITSCYDNPYRDQYLKFINEKRKKNPGKIVELIIPQFNNMFMPPYPFPYQYPYLNQNMFMYPQYQSSIPNQQNLNSQNNQNNNKQIPQQINLPFPPYQNYGINTPKENTQLNLQYQSQMNQMSIPINNQQINSQLSSPMNSQINIQLSPQVNHNNKFFGINNNELLSPKSNKESNSDNHINNMSDN